MVGYATLLSRILHVSRAIDPSIHRNPSIPNFSECHAQKRKHARSLLGSISVRKRGLRGGWLT